MVAIRCSPIDLAVKLGQLEKKCDGISLSRRKKNNVKLSKGDDEVMIVQSCLERWKFCKDETGTKFGAVEEEEEGHKFCVKSRDGIFDTTAAPSHYTVRWVSLQWRRSRTCEATKLISAAKVCDNLSTSFSPHKSVFFVESESSSFIDEVRYK